MSQTNWSELWIGTNNRRYLHSLSLYFWEEIKVAVIDIEIVVSTMWCIYSISIGGMFKWAVLYVWLLLHFSRYTVGSITPFYCRFRFDFYRYLLSLSTYPPSPLQRSSAICHRLTDHEHPTTEPTPLPLPQTYVFHRRVASFLLGTTSAVVRGLWGHHH